MGKWGTGLVLKVCGYCNVGFKARHDRKGRYCSRSCTAKANPPKSKKIDKVCKSCGNIYKVKKYKDGKTSYCSMICMHSHQPKPVPSNQPKRENHWNWKGGISPRHPSQAQAIVELKRVYKECQKCGSSKNLHGHHIIPYTDRPDLGAEKSNIIIICSKCHALEHPRYAHLILKGDDRK